VLPHVAQLLGAHRLDQKVARAVRHAAHDGAVLAARAHHDDGQVELQAHLLEEAEAVHVCVVDFLKRMVGFLS